MKLLWHRVNSKEVSYAVLVLLIVIAFYLYMYPVVRGMGVSDEAVYSYSMEYPSSLSQQFGQSFGYFVYGQLFLLLFGHSIFTPTIMTLSAIALTALFIFEILAQYGTRLGGLVGSALYLFNPLIYAYSNSFFPDIFICMLLTLSMLALLVAEKRKNRLLILLSGMPVVLGLFFGYQAAFAILGFIVFSFSEVLLKIKRADVKSFSSLFAALLPIILLVTGILIASLPYFFFVPGKPFDLASRMLAFYEGTDPRYNRYFYIYMLFPVVDITKLVMWGAGEIADAGILASLLVLASLALFKKRYRQILLPYSLTALVLTLYFTYGTQSLVYTPVQNMNRYIIPFIPFAAVGTALVIGTLKNVRIKVIITIIVMSAYIYTALPVYAYSSLRPGSPTVYSFFVHLQNALPYQNMQSYHLYSYSASWNQALPCYVFDIYPANCTGSTEANSSVCAQSKSLVISDTPVCSNQSGSGTAYTYANTSFSKYVYFNK